MSQVSYLWIPSWSSCVFFTSGIMAVVEVVIIALTPPDPVTIILEVISIGIALAESIKQQRQYRDQLKEAKRKMTIALADVTRANGRIDEECHKIETSWAELLGNGRKTLDNVNVGSFRGWQSKSSMFTNSAMQQTITVIVQCFRQLRKNCGR